jgi:Protein of unknown function (DUF1360)
MPLSNARTDSDGCTKFVLAAIATWRITHLLAKEDGPADLVVRFRARLGSGFAGKLMDCFNCLSVWVAAPVALLACRKPSDRILAWLALSGAACLLERAVQEPMIIQPMPETTKGNLDDGMLRPETSGAHKRPASAGDTA